MTSWTALSLDRQTEDADAPIVVQTPARFDGLGHALRRAFEPDCSAVETDFSALLARLR